MSIARPDLVRSSYKYLLHPQISIEMFTATAALGTFDRIIDLPNTIASAACASGKNRYTGLLGSFISWYASVHDPNSETTVSTNLCHDTNRLASDWPRTMSGGVDRTTMFFKPS